MTCIVCANAGVHHTRVTSAVTSRWQSALLEARRCCCSHHSYVTLQFPDLLSGVYLRQPVLALLSIQYFKKRLKLNVTCQTSIINNILSSVLLLVKFVVSDSCCLRFSARQCLLLLTYAVLALNYDPLRSDAMRGEGVVAVMMTRQQ